MSRLPNRIATSHMWPLNTWNMANEAGELTFSFTLIFNNHMCLVTTICDSTGSPFQLLFYLNCLLILVYLFDSFLETPSAICSAASSSSRCQVKRFQLYIHDKVFPANLMQILFDNFCSIPLSIFVSPMRSCSLILCHP